jgi:hypothetical protein
LPPHGGLNVHCKHHDFCGPVVVTCCTENSEGCKSPTCNSTYLCESHRLLHAGNKPCDRACISARGEQNTPDASMVLAGYSARISSSTLVL